MTMIINQGDEALTVNGSGIQALDILRRFRNIMIDQKAVRWDQQEALDWLNDAASEIVLRRPAARAVVEQVQLETGSLQRASFGSAQVLDVVRNIDANGKPGRSIRIADRQQIDDINPNWHRMRGAVTRHYMIDERAPTTFYVYPPALEGAVVEMLVSKPPPEVKAQTDTIDLRPEFINAVLNWMMYRAHSKDSEYSQGQVAMLHYQAFTDAIGAPAQAAQVNSATGNTQ